MTFSEEAAELHRLEAVALSLGLSERAFAQIAQEAVAEGHASGGAPEDHLREIRRRIHEVTASLRNSRHYARDPALQGCDPEQESAFDA